MTQTVTVDGVSRGSIVHREDCTWAEAAYLGETAEGQVVYHDDTGLITAAGFKDVVVAQDACTPVRIFTGFVGKKLIKKGSNWSDYAVSREYGFSTKDGNDLLTRLEARGASANRSKLTTDTVGATLHWLVDDELSRVGVLDHGAIDYVTSVGVDGTDRTGQKPGDVLAQLAKSARRNYYVRWHVVNLSCPVHGGADTASWELVFRDDNTSTDDTSTISISNYPGAADGETIFAPDVDPELGQDPEHVYSRMYVSYAKGKKVVERAATATAFVERDGDLEDTAVKKSSTAVRDGTTALWEAHTEAQILPVTLTLRHDQVNLILPGQRVSTRMTHLTPEGWEPARYARVLRRRVTQPQGTDYRYKVALDLSPQEAGPPVVGIVQSEFDTSGEGGINLSLPNPVTIGSDLIVVISDRGIAEPSSPNTDVALPRWGAGAWTRYPNTRVSNGVGPTLGDGVALYHKVADSTERTGFIGATNAVVGIFELSGMDWASRSEVHKLDQASAATMTIGSLGTPAAGAVAIMVGNWYDGSWPLTGTARSWVPGTGWTTDRVSPAYFGGAILWNAPASYIAHAVATGAALSASGTRGALEDGTGAWCGIAILIPPA